VVRGDVSAGVTNTAVAVTVPLEMSPSAPARPPTQTAAKLGESTPCSLNVVVVLTSTVKVVLSYPFKVKTPVAAVIPQARVVVVPLTEATVAKTPSETRWSRPW
jgi:hypothetical protein